MTTATVEGALDVDSAPTATGGSLFNVGGALTVNSTGVLTIGSGSALNEQTSVIAGSVGNTGQIILSGSEANSNGLASLTVNSAAGMGGQAGVLTGGVSLSGAAELHFASGGLTTIASGGDLALSGQHASVDVGSNQGGDSALSGLAAIDAEGVLDLENGAFLSIDGALDNSGAVDLGTSGSGSGVSLQIAGTLTNSGTLTLGNASDYLSDGSLSNYGLIEGQGVLNDLTNNSGGTIDANVSGQSLTLASLVNNGVLEANGGTLVVNGGSGSDVTGTGSAIVANGGVLDFNSAFNQNVTFQDNTGQLLLGQTGPSGFADSGTIDGFQAGDTIGQLSHGAVPVSVGYNATSQVLSIYSGANQTGSVLGALNIAGKQAGARPPVLDSEQALIEKRAELRGAEAAARQIAGQIAASRAKLDETISGFMADASDRRTKALQKLAGLEQQIAKARQRESYRHLVAPVDGVVQNVKIRTPGAVVTTADTLMTIVPDGTGIEIEANVENKDIGFVREGQDVEVKIDAFPFTRYGLIRGTVRKLGRDAAPAPAAQGGASRDTAARVQNAGSQAPTEDLTYPAKITLAQDWIGIDDRREKLQPGMRVSAEIKTGDRLVIEYILSPVTQAVSEAGRER